MSGVRHRDPILEPEESTSAEPCAADSELCAADAELLARARLVRGEQVVPEAVRARLLARALEEARRPSSVLPAAELVPVASRGLGLVFACAGAMALGVVLVANLRGEPSAKNADGVGVAPAVSAALEVERRTVGGGLFQSSLFHAPAALASGPPPPLVASLLGERPFSEASRSWQVRHWPDLSVGPAQRAEHELDHGAVCFPLEGKQRVVGGWPWLPEGEAGPRPVALTAGKVYRLVFQAWAHEPAPAQVLIAVGHAAMPFSAAAGARVPVAPEHQFFEVRFTAQHDDPSVGVAFLATGSGAAPTRLCIGDMTLTESASR
jgi:hypothetical protein